MVYEVTAHVETTEDRDAYLEWLGRGHVQGVLDGGALNAVVTVYPQNSGFSIESRYMFPTKDLFEAYDTDLAAALRSATAAEFGDRVRFDRKVGDLAFRYP